MHGQHSNILNVSNLLSFLRILLAYPIYYYLAKGQTPPALAFIAAAVITDFLDGYFARRLNQITEAGKILDPLADKICTITGFIALYLYQHFPLWLMLAIISRDVIILLASLYFLRRKKIVLPSNRLGKITIFVISVYAISFILKWHTVTRYLDYLVILLIVISIINYAIVFLTKLKNDQI